MLRNGGVCCQKTKETACGKSEAGIKLTVSLTIKLQTTFLFLQGLMAVYENRLVYRGVFGFVFVSKRQCVVESGAGEGSTEKRGGVYDHYLGLDV